MTKKYDISALSGSVELGKNGIVLSTDGINLLVDGVIIGQTGADGTNGVDGTNGMDGNDGAEGKSSYQVWLDEGNAGTEQDFLDSLKGTDGTNGIDGTNGTDGIDGNDGADGTNGTDGIDGNDGADGTNGTDGIDGNDGINGLDGQGVPIGGTVGQILAKVDGVNFNTQWIDNAGGSGGNSFDQDLNTFDDVTFDNITTNTITTTSGLPPSISSTTSLVITASEGVRIEGAPLRLPSLIQLEIDNLTSPQNGDMVYNVTANAVQVYSNGTWVNIA
jgi:hypothetical protein